MLSSPSQVVSSIDTLSERNKLLIEKWNSTPVVEVRGTVHDTIVAIAKEFPDEQAVCAWDGNLSYTELVEDASRLAVHLIELGVGAEVVVPLCFDKSKWNVIAILGVLIAGGCCKWSFLSHPIPSHSIHHYPP